MKGKMGKKRKINSVNNFINIADIKKNVLHTKDGHLVAFINLSDISISTMSKTDIKILLRTLTSELSGFKYKIRFFKISKPIDISGIIQKYKSMFRKCDDVTEKARKILLKEATVYLHKYTTNDLQLENKYYLILKIKDEDSFNLEKQIEDVSRRFLASKIDVRVCENEEILMLLNLFFNPTMVSEKNININSDVSIIREFIGDEENGE